MIVTMCLDALYRPGQIGLNAYSDDPKINRNLTRKIPLTQVDTNHLKTD